MTLTIQRQVYVCKLDKRATERGRTVAGSNSSKKNPDWGFKMCFGPLLLGPVSTRQKLEMTKNRRCRGSNPGRPRDRREYSPLYYNDVVALRHFFSNLNRARLAHFLGNHVGPGPNSLCEYATSWYYLTLEINKLKRV